MTPQARRHPDAQRQDVVEELHGLRVADPYRWLEDAGSAATLRWGAGQDALYEAERASWQDLGRWEAQVAAVEAVDRARSPEIRGDRLFWLRQDAGREHPVLMVAQAGENAQAASIIGEACSVKRVMTTALVLGGASISDESLAKTLSHLRPWALMLVIASADEYIADMLTALRA